MKFYRVIALSLLPFSIGVSGAPAEECPLFGPSFPTTFDISSTKAWRNAKVDLPKQLEQLFSESLLNRTHTAFAIDVFSTTTNTSIYSYYHTGSALENTLTAGKFTENTISRVGSVTKLLTIYAILASRGYDILNDPVTRYLPELSINSIEPPLDHVNWEDITVGALASNQGGTGGAPAMSTMCYNTPEGCSNKDFLRFMRDSRRPVAPAFHNAYYSDAGFIVLGRVLERIKNMPYDEAIKSALSEPLKLNATSSFKPEGEDRDAIILPGDFNISSFGYDNQLAAPSGGLYTNIADLRALGLSILNSEILPSTATRRWMKPMGATETSTFLVGAPWEINRLQVPVSAGSSQTRLSDLYTKMGANVGYSAGFALSPDHGIGYSIMSVGATAGDNRFILRDIVGSVVVPAAEAAAADNAAENYVGFFADEQDEHTNLTLSFDEDSPGLRIKSYFEDGVDTRSTVRASPVMPDTEFVSRMYPINSSPANFLQAGEGNVTLAFRATRETLPLTPSTKPSIGRGIFMNDCTSWFLAGFAEDLDEFVLEVVNGKVESVKRSSTGRVMKWVRSSSIRQVAAGEIV